MKPAIALSIILLALLGMSGLALHEINVGFRQAEISHQKWVEFSQRNHCRIVRERSFSEPSTLWECDGNFQVERNGN